MSYRNLLGGLLMGLFLLATPAWAQPQPVDEPLPMIGTAAHGHAYPGEAVQADAVDLFKVKTTDGKAEITIDTTAAPDLKDWAQNKLAPVLAEWYPKIVASLPSEGFTAPTRFKITLKPMDGVAYTVGQNITANSIWLQSEIKGEAVGSLVHECVHVVQQYHDYNDAGAPGWIVEGMADYFRWFKYEPQSHGADIVWMRKLEKRFTPHYDDSYRISANFLNWVTEKCDPNIVTEVNAALRQGKYTDDFWKQHTGKTVQELGAEWRNDIKVQLQSASAGN